MKRHFLLLLLYTVLFYNAYSESKYSQYLDPEWLSYLNSTQKGMILEEFERSAEEMDKLNLTEEQEMNKVHEMIGKVRDGFWIYRLSSMNEALADSVKTFNETTGLKVYVYSYVEDAGFLNNIFKRLSEAKYTEVAPEGYIIYKLIFKRTREPQGEEFIMAYAPTLTVETDQYDKINKKLTELNTLGLSEFTEGTTHLNSEQLFDKKESCTRSLTSILAQMKDISYNTSESTYLSFDLLKAEMEPIKEKITFITPAGTGITLPSGSKIVDGNYRGDVLSPEGVLFGFILPSGKLYMARIENFPVLSGYYQYEEKTGRFGRCYTDSEPVVSGRKKIWHIRREEDETARQCSLSVSEGTYNFTAEYSFKLDGTRTSKLISTWDITANYSETTGGNKFQTPCIDKTTSTHPQPLTKKTLPQSLDDYAYRLHQHLKQQGTDCAIWLGECAENDQVQVITREQSTHSTLSNTQARRMVETGTFNTGIAIYGCYDPATGKWKIISNYKKGSLKPNAKFKGQLSEEKAEQISDEYVEKILKERTGKGGEAGGLQRTTEGEAERLPDGDEFKHDHLSLFEAVLAIKDFTKSIVEQARVPEEFWNNSPDNLEKYINSPVHIPAVLCGVGDQTLEELTGAVQLLYFGLDLATDPQKARAMYRSLANMKWEDVKSAAEKTLVSASGYDNYSAGGCKARYQGGRHGVTIAMTVFAITKMAKVKDVLDKAEEGVKEGAGKVGKFTAKQIEGYVELATNNQDATKVMLGKTDGNGVTGYVARARNDHTFFKLTDEKWNEALNSVGNDIDEMWKINKEFIDQQKGLGKEFYLSHNPNIASGFYFREVDYLTKPVNEGGLGGKIINIHNNLWKVIW